MDLMSLDAKVLHLLVRDLDSSFVAMLIQDRFHLQPGSCPGCPNEVDNAFITPKRLSLPGQTDVRKQTMFYSIPLAGPGREMAHGNRNSDFIGQFLYVNLPGSRSAAITPSTVGADEQPPRRAISSPSIHFPPPANTFRRELGGVVRNPHVHHSPVPGHIIGAIGNGVAFCLGRKIMYVHLDRSTFRPPRPPLIFKGSHQLLLFRIDRDHRISARPKLRFLPIDVTKLRVAVGMLG